MGVFAYRSFENVILSCEATETAAEIVSASKEPPAQHPSEIVAYKPLQNKKWTRLSGVAGEAYHYKFEMPPGASSAKVRLKGGSGYADLYANFDHPTTIGDEEANMCVRKSNTNNEHCGSNLKPLGTVLYVSVFGESDFRNARLKVRVR